jgi:hypothetical protein
MAKRIFISYNHKDQMKAKGFNLLQWNKNVDVEFVGRHLLDPVDSKNKDYIRSKVVEQLTGTSVSVVLLGSETADSDWVKWEIDKSIEKKNGILAIKLDDTVPDPPANSPVGEALQRAGAEVIGWEPDKFQDAIDRAFKAAGRIDSMSTAAGDPSCGR